MKYSQNRLDKFGRMKIMMQYEYIHCVMEIWMDRP